MSNGTSNAGANAGSLADLQRAFQDYLFISSDRFSGAVRDTKKADRTILLDVYRDGYAARLIEVLTNDYPGLMAMAGPDDFDYMARAYIAAHPSHHPSVRWFGRGVADFLATTPPFNGNPAPSEMARFEWALGDAFDSPDTAPIAAEALMAMPPEAWETLSFAPVPSLQLMTLTFDVPQAWQRREEQEPGNLEVEPAVQPTGWVVWRREFAPNFRSLDTDEAAALAALARGPVLPRSLREPGRACRRGPGGGARRRPVTRLGGRRNDRVVPFLGVAFLDLNELVAALGEIERAAHDFVDVPTAADPEEHLLEVLHRRNATLNEPYGFDSGDRRAAQPRLDRLHDHPLQSRAGAAACGRPAVGAGQGAGAEAFDPGRGPARPSCGP